MVDSFAEKRFNAVKRGELLLYKADSLTLVEDKTHPLYDERVSMPLSEALVKSIAAQGVLEPVVVRRNGEDSAGTPLIEVVDGRQRVRAVREVNKGRAAARLPQVLVPAVLRRGDEGDVLSAMVAANELRTQTDAVSNARKLKRYLDLGYSEQDAEIVFGTNRQGIRNLLALVACSHAVRTAVKDGQLPLATARVLSALPQAEQDATLEQMSKAGFEGTQAVAKQARGERGRLRAEPKHKCRAPKEVAAAREAAQSGATAEVRAVLDWVLGQRKTCPGLKGR